MKQKASNSTLTISATTTAASCNEHLLQIIYCLYTSNAMPVQHQGYSQGHMTLFFQFLGPIISLEWLKLSISNYVGRLSLMSISVHMIGYPRRGCVPGYTTSSNFLND